MYNLNSSAKSGRDIYLHIGSGLVAPETWVNIDASWNALLAKFPCFHKILCILRIIKEDVAKIPWPKNIKIHNVLKGLPYHDGCVAAIYASHFLEHLTRTEGMFFLRECHRVLRRGGYLRLVVPDLELLSRNYIAMKAQAHAGDPKPVEEFLRATGLYTDYGETTLLLGLYRRLTDFNRHKWLYDYDSLMASLVEIGFSEVRKRGYLESDIPLIADVEHEDRLKEAYCVEATR